MNEVEVTQELIPSKTINVPDLFTNKDVARILVQSIRQKALDFVPDVSTAKGRKEIASQAYKVAQSKTFLDGLGKQFLSDLKAQTKSGDEIRKFIRDECDLIKCDTRKELDEYEEAEKAEAIRIEAERQYMSDWDDAISENDLVDRQREIERREAELVRIEVERKSKEEAERLERERKEREERIAKEAAEKAKREAEFKAKAEQERIEREKREAEERARQAEQARRQAIEDAKREAELAEQRRIEAEKQAELNRQIAIKEAEERARQEAARKEQERIAKESAEKAEAERRARHKAHQAKINREVLACFVENGFEEATAKNIIQLIYSGNISHVTINY